MIVFAGNVHTLHPIHMEELHQSPLGHCAAKEGHAECLQILSVLGAGALLTAIGHNGDTQHTPLLMKATFTACKSCTISELVQRLLLPITKGTRQLTLLD